MACRIFEHFLDTPTTILSNKIMIGSHFIALLELYIQDIN